MKNYSKYLTPSSDDEKWGLYTITTGYTKTETKQTYPVRHEHPQSHAFNWNTGRILNGYYIVFITKGLGLFESQYTNIRSLKAGDCFLLFPGVWHRYKPDTTSGWEEYWVGFKGAYADSLMAQNFSAEAPFITAGLNNELLKLFHELLNWVQQGPPGYQQIISGINLQILGLLNSINNAGEATISPASKYVEAAKFLLRENIENAAKLESILKSIPVSYSKLRKDFKTLTGRSPNQYQLDVRLEKAKDLLATTNLSISEVAYKTGFQSASYLSKVFTKNEQVSPKTYRHTHNPYYNTE